ncbi:hypothetical protein [Prosthecobacter sp.]|jgi:hypothetical protein|uniref:hypothetical protein n=1 Tax=Prosthecobacter sp. TaxID=1965333 RepID=UPI0037841EBD
MSDRTWHLLKASDKDIFGPTDLETLRGWAADAKISPLDKISSDDRLSWQRAPMIPELQMDLLVQMPDNYLYGPTNVATIQEFLATGEIDENVTIINCLDNTESRLSELGWFKASPHQVRSASTTLLGTQRTDDKKLPGDAQQQSRIGTLERQVMDLQRVVDEWQQAYNSLRQQFIEATGRDPV